MDKYLICHNYFFFFFFFLTESSYLAHGGVGIGTDTGIRVCKALVVKDNAGKVLDVDLVDNTGSRRNNAEVGEVAVLPQGAGRKPAAH